MNDIVPYLLPAVIFRPLQPILLSQKWRYLSGWRPFSCMTDYQKEILKIMKGPNVLKSAKHKYLEQGSKELKELLSKQKQGKHWKLVNGKRVWY